LREKLCKLKEYFDKIDKMSLDVIDIDEWYEEEALLERQYWREYYSE